MKHSNLGASGAERWFNCSASVKLQEGIPSVSSEAAKEGTLAHELAEQILLNRVPNASSDKNVHEAVWVYTDYVFNKGCIFLNHYIKDFNSDLNIKNVKTLCTLSFYGGLAQSESGSGLCHAMAHTLEQEFKISHAESVLLCSFISLDYKRKNLKSNNDSNTKKIFVDLYKLIFSEAKIRKNINILDKIDPMDFIKRAKLDPCWKLEKERIDEIKILKLLKLKIRKQKWNI